MIFLPLLFSACFAASVYGQNLHKLMTKEETELVFKVNHDEVHLLEYEVVTIFHKTEEVLQTTNPTIHLRAFNRNYTLYLEKNTNTLLGTNTPVFITSVDDGHPDDEEPRIIYYQMPYPLPRNFNLYHDLEKRAAITLHTDDDNKVHVHGTVGDDIIIRSLPPRLHKEVLNERSNQFSNSHPSFIDNSQFTHHVVIKPSKRSYRPSPSSSVNQRNKFSEQNNELSAQKIKISHPRSGVPSTASSEEQSNITAYPEILVVVDYETYKIHGFNTREVAKYVAAFWNGVDLRYRELDSPKVRLNIAGLIIPQHSDAHRYMDVFYKETKTILVPDVLEKLGKHFMNASYLPKDKYDFVAAITHRILGKIEDDGKFSDTYYGYGYVGTACWTNGQNVAIVSDKGGFDGITTAAHEVAHLLNSVHDGSESAIAPGGPCSWEDGYLMSYIRENSNTMHWSECSKNLMRLYLKSDESQCLKNKPNVGTPYPKTLPGYLLSRDVQCQRRLGLNSCKEREDDCAILYCAKEESEECETNNLQPAEGSYCGKGKICLDAQCVDNPEL